MRIPAEGDQHSWLIPITDLAKPRVLSVQGIWAAALLSRGTISSQNGLVHIGVGEQVLPAVTDVVDVQRNVPRESPLDAEVPLKDHRELQILCRASDAG